MHLPKYASFFSRLAVLTSISLVLGPAGDGSAGTYKNSAHGGYNTAGRGVARASMPTTYSAGNCAHCHEQHASIGGSEPTPAGGPANFLLLDDLDTSAGNAACNYCHDGSVTSPVTVDNIASQITKTYHHDPFSALGSVLCNDCHDSHVAQNTNHQEAVNGNTIPATSPLLAVAGVSLNYGAPGAPASGAEGFGVLPNPTALDPVTMEYQLCFKCHGGQAAYPLLADLRGQFHPGNYSVHPVTTENNATWNNLFLRTTPAAFNATWGGNINAEMYCSDCHGSETGGDPQGPHGSTIQYLLKAGGPPAPAGNFDALCLKCHNDPALPGMSFWVDVWNTALVGDHSYFGHQSVVTNPGAGTNALGCLACHGDSGGPLVSNIHGANYMGVVNNPGTDTPLPSFTFLVSSFINKLYFTTAVGNVAGARYCEATCHAADGAAGYAY